MNERTGLVPLKMFKPIWHVASRLFNTRGLTTFRATKVGLNSVAIPEIDPLSPINNSTLE
jgi:hypothetical protein